jgi:D-3-phosphoglycerate dehydrogenase
MKILLLENIHPLAKKNLEEYGFEVDLLTYSPAKEELIGKLQNYDVVGIRSKTKMTKEILDEVPHLLAIGCFCIGTNQVDLEAAKELGICVFNAPHSNTRSVAELVIAEVIALSRQLCDRSMRAHIGTWEKSAIGSNEVRGKTIGIIGYGHIGSQVSILAEAVGLKVCFYDVVKRLPLGNAKSITSIKELMNVSDFVTLHVPELESTKDMITSVELGQMKKGSYLINASRGSVVVIEDLVVALKEKHLSGCAIDVFPSEPASNAEKFTNQLQGIDNVILTPHIGGSTEEAQVSIGAEVSESIMRYLKFATSLGAVNIPNVDLVIKENTKRMVNIHRNEPGVLSEINSIISEAGMNIDGQSLATDDKIGYLIMDVHDSHIDELSQKIKSLERSIVTRAL